MASVRISEIANELGYPSKEIVIKAQELGLKVKTHSNGVSNEDAAAIYEYVQTGIIPEKYKKASEAKTVKKPQKSKSVLKEDKQDKPVSDNTLKKEEDKAEKAQISKDDTDSNIIKSESRIKETETLADVGLQKRRGLVIVKKKKDVNIKPESEPKQSSSTTAISFSDIFASSTDTVNIKKKKKDKKPTERVSKKDSAERMDFMGGSDFGDIVIDDEDVVVLPDLSFRDPIPNTTSSKLKQPAVMKQSVGNSLNMLLEGGIHRRSRKKHKKVERKESAESVSSINISKEIRVYEFAEKLNKQPSEIISKLFMLGMMTTKNDFLDEDAIEILADEFNVEVNIIDTQKDFDYIAAYDESVLDDESNLKERAPVITIMGHVDHGKTSLLDYIRSSRIAAGEAGGITQHVGAYMVQKDGRTITFIDTPGHEAFSAMRARGAGITDIVIIVVAADDGVKPQTKEAINHAKAAGVPIIIAINKMDKPGANPDLVKTGLAELDIMPTEWGGSHEFAEISAKTGQGIDELLEIVLLQADLLELKANPSVGAKATIVESSLQKGRGAVSTVIVQNGTLKVGDVVVAGVAYGKVRSLLDDQGKPLKSIAPGECGVVVGLSEVAESGETLIAVKTDKEAREYANKKAEYLRQKELSKSTKVTIDELSAKIAEGELKSLPVIVKADVGGSLEAIKASLEKLANDEIRVNIIHSGVGGITQSDVSLANASENCVILGFNIRPTGEIKEKAKELNVQIKTYNVIYNLIDDIKSLLSGLMSPVIREEQLGQAQVRQVISVPKVGTIAGCLVSEGIISRGAKIRLIREGVVIHEGQVSSLKRFKDDVKEVAKGYECGVGIEGYNDIREGDYIESYKQIQEQASI